jgi:hypothetical protein
LHVPSEVTLILGGLGLIFASIQNPEGLSGSLRQQKARISQILTARNRGSDELVSHSGKEVGDDS